MRMPIEDTQTHRLKSVRQRTCRLEWGLLERSLGCVQDECTRLECGDNVFEDSGQKGVDRQLEETGAQLDGRRDPHVAAT
jgi:hypothetical protein